ncbi:MAG: ABC transporter substrate-binding protein [Myxococcota bacterium]
MRTILLTSLLCLSFSAAAEAQGSARAFLEAQHAQANRVLERAEGPARERELTGLLNELLDYDALSQAALADHWEAQSDEARAEFVSTLRQLVERSYRANLQRTFNFDVSYENDQRRGQRVLVATMARSRQNRRAPPVSIDYTLVRDGRRWRVVDITTDGQSLVEGYRAQFNRLIEREGWDGLMSRMRRRLEG